MTLIYQGLQISGIGMGLVFLMILALWGIMALLVKLTNKPETIEQTEEALDADIMIEPLPVSDPNAPLAAAIAVALALENQAASYAFKPSPSRSSENAWLSAGRTQQLYSNTIRGRNR